jgi:predicted O-methyltransferase YrrM
MILLLAVALVLVATVAVALGVNVVRLRAQKRRWRNNDWPIRTVRVDECDDAFATDDLGPTLATEVAFIGTVDTVGATSDTEGWILAVLAMRATRLFEFGTATGRTAYLWARNSPPEARITTLTLPPARLDVYEPAPGDDEREQAAAMRYSGFTRFYYTGTPVEGKVDQHYGDSKTFDETPFLDACDVVFVDGSHAYSYVVSDSRKALRMVRPGGLVLWHDYRGPGEIPDVYRALNELAESLPLRHIKGTSLIAYRRPA